MAASQVQYWNNRVAAASSLTVSISGTTANNLLVVFFSCANSGGVANNISTSGWTTFQKYAQSGGAGNLVVAAAYKIADGTETAVAWNANTSADIVGSVVEISGTATSSVLDTSGIFNPVAVSASTAYSVGALTPTQAGIGIIGAMYNTSANATACTIGGGYTEWFEWNYTTTYDPEHCVGTATYTSGDQEPTATITQSIRLGIITGLFKEALVAKNVSHLLCLGTG